MQVNFEFVVLLSTFSKLGFVLDLFTGFRISKSPQLGLEKHSILAWKCCAVIQCHNSGVSDNDSTKSLWHLLVFHVAKMTPNLKTAAYWNTCFKEIHSRGWKKRGSLTKFLCCPRCTAVPMHSSLGPYFWLTKTKSQTLGSKPRASW